MAENNQDVEKVEKAENEEIRSNFIYKIIEQDLEEGVYDRVHTRFPQSQMDICI